MSKPEVLFTYWGRRGALSQFAIELARSAIDSQTVTPIISVSKQNEIYGEFCDLPVRRFDVDTFSSGRGAIINIHRAFLQRRRLQEFIAGNKIKAVVELLPHVWSPLIMPAVGRAGSRYCTVVHDADAHPGDPTSIVNPILHRAARQADLVFALSGAVYEKLIHEWNLPKSGVVRAFHPDLSQVKMEPGCAPEKGKALRLLFLGRILPYKGLSLFLDTIDVLRAQSIDVEVGVYGEGALDDYRSRLSEIDAEIVNRWLTQAEILDALNRFHAVVLSHVEASQSGVAGLAFGAGVPVIATPVGGLKEQVVTGRTGVLADACSPAALAEAAKKLLLDGAYYAQTKKRLRETAGSRSMAKFIDDVAAAALQS